MNERLVVKDLTKSFKEVTALRRVNFKFEKGKLYVVMGESGAGKTTLLNILALLSKPSDGQVLINGKDVSQMSENMKADMRNRTIGFVFQTFNLLPNLSACDNVGLPMFVRKDLSMTDIEDRSKILLTHLGLEHRMRHKPKDLSAGEKQRVAIARALINEPDIILADEPTGNLDEKNSKHILSILRDVANQGKTVIVVTHDQLAKAYSHVNLEMAYGEVINCDGEL